MKNEKNTNASPTHVICIFFPREVWHYQGVKVRMKYEDSCVSTSTALPVVTLIKCHFICRREESSSSKLQHKIFWTRCLVIHFVYQVKVFIHSSKKTCWIAGRPCSNVSKIVRLSFLPHICCWHTHPDESIFSNLIKKPRSQEAKKPRSQEAEDIEKKRTGEGV